MKKVLFLAVTLMLSLSSAAQGYYVSNDDYVYTINDGIVLTGEQWHTNDASILAANNSQYLVVRGPTREYQLSHKVNLPKKQLYIKTNLELFYLQRYKILIMKV